MGQKKQNQLSRRGLLAGAGAVAIGGAGLASTVGAGSAVAAAGAGAPQPTAFGPVTVRAGDLRYENLVRGNNFRFVGRPDEICLAGSTDQVIRAVSDAVRSGRRIAVRSGGHCFENFTTDPVVRMLLDLSPMDAVGYDAGRRAFAV
jgi:aclacinomycin oxidase